VDEAYQIILAGDVTAAPNDKQQAAPMQVQADALNLSIDELARQILGEAVATRGDEGAAWQVCNQPRVELIRKQFAEGLGSEESSELQRLQDQADQYVEHLDEQRLDDVKRRRGELPATY
jgi:hypothetical protein